MQADETMLQETVVIGYGVQRKSDLTGSVANVSSKDFNQGVISSPEQLILLFHQGFYQGIRHVA